METAACPSRCRLLAEILRDHLAQGKRLDPQTLRFIEATYGAADAPALAGVLSDGQSSDTESLLELLFYPDLPLQRRVEELLCLHRFEEADPARVVQRLADPPLEARIVFGRHLGEVTLRPPKPVVGRMVSRLRPTRNLPSAIADSCRKLAPPIAVDVRIRVRNAAKTPSPAAARCIGAFLAAAELPSDVLLDSLQAALELTGDIPDDDMEAGLIRRRRDLVDTIDRARHRDREAAGQNMETRILGGMRTPHIDRAEIQKKIAQIDLIRRYAFGQADPTGEPVASVDLGDLAADRDLAALVRMLS